MTPHKTPRYALKLAELSSRPFYVQEAALVKAIVNGRQWEMDAALAAINTNMVNWNYIDKTLLFKQAAIYNRLPVIEQLVDIFEIKHQGKHNCNPWLLEAYDAAMIHSHYAIGDYCRALGAGPSWQLENNRSPRAMSLAMKDGDLKKVIYLLDASQEEPSLHADSAACFGTPEIMDYMLSKGVDINQVDRARKTLFVIALQMGRMEMARHLLAKGANPVLNAENADSAMTYSIMGNHMDMVVTLITRGVTPTEKHIQDAETYKSFEIADLLKKALPVKTAAPKP